MQHAILGPGGIGGVIGALLARSGEAVRLIVRPGSVEGYPHELSLKSKSETFSAPVSVASTLTQPVDVLWITVKATDLLPALESISSSEEIGVVVPLLNGIDHIALLRQRFGFKLGPATFGIFDTFNDEQGRSAHVNGEVAKALFARDEELFVTAPQIQMVDIVAEKL